MSRGYVYALVNDAMPGIVKIGRTERSVVRRANELYQTGVPQPFKVLHSAFCPDCKSAERDIHEILNGRRLSKGREFFEVSHEEVMAIISDVVQCQLNELFEEFFPDSVRVDSGMCVDPVQIQLLAFRLDEHPFIVASAIEEMTPDEVSPALDRFLAKIKAGASKQ